MKLLSFLLLCILPAIANAKPNVLLIIADDCTFSDLPLHGGKNAQTPHLDVLAKESLVNRFLKRPAEELYHTAQDPFELKNLTDDPRFAKIKAKLAAALDQHLADQKDPGLPLDTKKAHRAAAKLTPLFQSKRE